MKRTLLLAFILAGTFRLQAQTQGYESLLATNCYTDYYQAFRDRGSKPVPDGVTEVVISIRKDGACKCLMGKITVKNGVPINDLYLAREDGNFEKYLFVPSPKYARSESVFKNYISNGMSPTYLSFNEELVNLFFISYLNPTPANFKVAPAIK